MKAELLWELIGCGVIFAAGVLVGVIFSVACLPVQQVILIP